MRAMTILKTMMKILKAWMRTERRTSIRGDLRMTTRAETSSVDALRDTYLTLHYIHTLKQNTMESLHKAQTLPNSRQAEAEVVQGSFLKYKIKTMTITWECKEVILE
jgi:hypothetical protein